MATTGRNAVQVGSYNQSVVLDTIRRLGPTSRVEIAASTGLSAQTVTNIVRRLLSEGWVRESGKTRTSGKPRTLLELAEDAGYAFGVHVDPFHTRLVVLNANGEPIAHKLLPTAERQPESVVSSVAKSVTQLIGELKLDPRAVLGLGIGVPGPVDVESGVMIHPTHLPKWHGFPLADRLRQETGLNVVVEKDVVAAAIAHRWSMENSTESAVIVYVGTGIGAGVVSEGRVVRGATGNSGSVAHIVIDTSAEAELCRCGRRGCVTATASPTALVRRAKEAGLQLPGPTNREALTELFDMARTGDPVAKRLVDSAVSGLTTMVLALTDLLEPDRLVLGGPFWAVYRSGLLDGLRQLLNDPPEDSPLDGIEVSESALGDELGAIGAGLLVLDRQLTP